MLGNLLKQAEEKIDLILLELKDKGRQHVAQLCLVGE